MTARPSTNPNTDTDTDADQPKYVQVHPSDDPLKPSRIPSSIRRLHSIVEMPSGLFSRFRSPPSTTIECLLLAKDDRLTYAFSIHGDDDAETDDLSVLERILRSVFPRTYEIERTTLPEFERFVEDDSRSVSAIEFKGKAKRRDDWQTNLNPFLESDYDYEQTHAPLTSLAESMVNADCPMVYQALIRPKKDWTYVADDREIDLENATDTLSAKVLDAIIVPLDEGERNLLASDEKRIEELKARNTMQSFEVNARVLALTDEETQASARSTLKECASVFGSANGQFHRITSDRVTGRSGRFLKQAVGNPAFHRPTYERLWTRIPWAANKSTGIVADPSEVGHFCLLGGEGLTVEGSRGLETTPGERTSIPRPPESQLETYQGEGLTLGQPVDTNRTTGDPLSLPPSLQPMHVAWFGKTGSGKSTALTAAILDNHHATDGADVFIDPKGDGMTVDYLRAHHERYGNLEDVLYFDCTELLPAISVFDIRELLDADIPRDQAVEYVIAHYLEMLQAIMGTERFEQAVRSPDVIRALIKALFDPVSGDDAFAHKDLHEATRRLANRQAAPPVSDPELERTLEGLVENDSQTFQDILQGVSNRIEKITLDKRLATMFNHVAPEKGESENESDTPNLDFGDLLNENKTVIFDLGGLRSEPTRVVSLVVLSALWNSLKRRSEAEEDSPVVNLYLEEAATLAVTDLLSELLSQGRGFGLSVTLAMQYPAQLRDADERAYNEVLNDVGTFVVGNVPLDRKLAERLATADMDREDVGARLRALSRGEWLVKPAAEYGAPDVRPFQVESVDPPTGHPASDEDTSNDLALFGGLKAGFETARLDAERRTENEYGVTVQQPNVVTERQESETGTANGEIGADTETADGSDISNQPRVDSALPHTQRIPDSVRYDESTHALVCEACEARYAPRMEGMEQALRCCAESETPLEDVHRDDVPVCALDLKLSPEERAVTPYSTGQLCFLQAVFNASQLRYQHLGYDLREDSMVRLREYTGVDHDAVTELIDEELLRKDCRQPHTLYSLTPAGREAIGESFREGVAFGDGSGDLDESSQHVLAVELGRELLKQEYVRSTDSTAVAVNPYYESESVDGRLDCAALDANGDVVVALEAERVNHDVREAVPSDFDKMAACEPEAAIWIVMGRTGGHQVLQALNDPADGEPRVTKEYKESTAPRDFKVDTEGLTRMYSLRHVMGTLGEE